MKRFLACAVLIGLCGLAGCFTSAPPKELEHEPTALAEPEPRRPLTADQINAKNVVEKAQEFEDELDQAQKRLYLKTPH
jgi:hypothetical protein